MLFGGAKNFPLRTALLFVDDKNGHLRLGEQGLCRRYHQGQRQYQYRYAGFPFHAAKIYLGIRNRSESLRNREN